MRIQTQDYLEDLALECYEQARSRADSDVESARKFFAMAWGFYTHLENTEFMRLCERFLENTGLNKTRIKGYKRYGFHNAGICIGVYEYFKQRPE